MVYKGHESAMIIYKAVNRINGKIYVGQTIQNLSRRIASHLDDPKYPFGKALRKYGLQSFEISVIDDAKDVSVLNEKERYWIKAYDCMVPKGYNLTDGGRSGNNRSLETRKKLSDAHTPERRKKNSERMSGEDNPSKRPEVRKKRSEQEKGKIVSLETRKKQSEAHIGRIVSEETRQKKSKAAMGHPVSDAVCEAARVRRLGTHHTEETRQRLREARAVSGHYVSEEARQRMSLQRKGVPRTEEVKQKMRGAKERKRNQLRLVA